MDDNHFGRIIARIKPYYDAFGRILGTAQTPGEYKPVWSLDLFEFAGDPSDSAVGMLVSNLLTAAHL